MHLFSSRLRDGRRYYSPHCSASLVAPTINTRLKRTQAMPKRFRRMLVIPGYKNPETHYVLVYW